MTYPSAPRDLSAEVSGTTVNLSWSAPSDDGGELITNYSWEWRDDDGGFWAAGGSPTGTSDSFNGSPDRTYEFRVAAHNSRRGRWRHIFANT